MYEAQSRDEAPPRGFMAVPLSLDSDRHFSFERLDIAWHCLVTSTSNLCTAHNNANVKSPPTGSLSHVQPLFFGGCLCAKRSCNCVHGSVTAFVRLTGSAAKPFIALCVRSSLANRSTVVELTQRLRNLYHGCHEHDTKQILPGEPIISAARNFWENQLRSIVEAPIYTLKADVVNNDSAFEICETTVDAHSWSRFQQLEQTSPDEASALLFAAWANVLRWHQDAGDDTVVFAITLPNVISQMPESSTRSLPLRISLPVHTTTVSEHIDSVLDTFDQSCLHAIWPFDDICAEAGVNGFTWTTNVLKPNSLTAPFMHMPAENSSRDFPINVDVGTVDGTGYCSIAFRAYYPRGKMEIILDHFREVVQCLLDADPGSPCAIVRLLSEREEEFLKTIANPKTQEASGMIHHLFEEQVTRTPDNAALQFEDGTIVTYRQLNATANKVARQLKCGRGDLVPVCMQRSINLVVAILAILKSGAAYVILDPEVPPERNEFIVEDVSAPFVLSDTFAARKVPRTLLVETLSAATPDEHAITNLDVHQDPSDLCYVIYTSGSTGRPKGVLLEHRAAYSGLVAFPYLPELRQLLFHNPVFSAAQRSIWSTLKQGGCLCIASKTNITVNIAETIRNMNINVIDVTPSTASLITPGTVPCLKRMTVAGELINPALIPDWIDHLQLLNAYGLSENTQFNWRNVITPGQNPQNIGRPVDTTTAYVLQPETTRLSPLLVPGELCLGGHQLARGYLNRAEKTKEAFIPNPFGEGRLYRTGDMVITHEDGSIEMVGRIDFQVKINDQRVEPGEPNALLQIHPDVQESAIVSANVKGKKALVASLVSRQTVEWEELQPSLKRYLIDRVPSYMVPSHWFSFQKLPLNINGKVDIPTLKMEVESRAHSEYSHRAHSSGLRTVESRVHSPREELLKRLWSETLGVECAIVSREDNFFESGGTSLEAIKIASKARKLYLNVSVTDIMETSSLAHLAKTVSEIDSAQEVFGTPKPFQLSGRYNSKHFTSALDAYPVTETQREIIAEHFLNSGQYIYDRAYKLHTDHVSFERALKSVMCTSPIYRTIFQGRGKTILQVVMDTYEPDMRSFDGSLQEWLGTRQHSRQMMGLGSKQIEVTLIKDDVVIVTMHHAIFDFWSHDFLVDDIRSFLQGLPITKRPPFNLYVQHLAMKDRATSLAFWRSYLADLETMPLPRNDSGGFFETYTLPVDITEWANEMGIATPALLYACWAMAVSRVLACEDVIFAITLSGRDAPIADIDSMAGPLLELAPLRSKVEPESSVVDIARNITNDLRIVRSHAFLGLTEILKCAAVPTDLCLSLVNYLIQEKQNQDTPKFLVPIPIPQVPSTNRLVLEMESSRSPATIKIMSTAGFDGIVQVREELFNIMVNARENQAPHTPRPAREPPLNPGAIDKTAHDPVDEVRVPESKKRSLSRMTGMDLGVLALSHGVTFSCFLCSAWALLLLRRCSMYEGSFLITKLTNSSPSVEVLIDCSKCQTLGDIYSCVGKQECDTHGAKLPEKQQKASKNFARLDALLPHDASFDKLTAVFHYEEQGSNTRIELSGCGSQTEFWMDGMEALLSSIKASSVDVPLTAFKVMGLSEWSYLQQLADYQHPAPDILQSKFEQIASAHPHFDAVQWSQEPAISYGDLEKQSNLLARYLRSIGVLPGSFVGLYMDKSIHAIISILAILKAGACFVPLGFGNPPERNAVIIKETMTSVVICEQGFHDFMPLLPNLTKVFADAIKLDETSLHMFPLPSSIDPRSIAYTIYTSGSTSGAPKGVQISHTAASCAVNSMLQAETRHNGRWRTLQFANYAFDASIQDIFNTLSSGGCLCMTSSEALLSDLPGVISEMDVRQAILTPTVARLMSPDRVPGFELMILGGEQMSHADLNTWAQRRLLNVYGPTEASMVVSTKFLGTQDDPRNIGCPLPTVGVVIVQESTSHPVPFGAVGEICVTGPQLSSGYLGREDLTKDSFQQCTFNSDDNMYRTGDIGKWLPRNELLILGRKDTQVKVSGHRIELGEIEDRIRQSDVVWECAVDVIEVGQRPHLAAFCVFKKGHGSSIRQPNEDERILCISIREQLKLLASYMFPKYVFAIDNLPRLASNKTDRRSLRNMVIDFEPHEIGNCLLEAIEGVSKTNDDHSTSEEEAVMQEAFAEVFGIANKEATPETNFHALGGDSIAAINVVAVCRNKGWVAQVGDILKLHPIRNAAGRLRRLVSPEAPSTRFEPPKAVKFDLTLQGLVESDIVHVFPCPPGQEEFLDQGSREEQFWVLMTVRQFPDEIDFTDWFKRVRQLTVDNEILRSTFTKVENRWIGVVLADGEPWLDSFDLSRDHRSLMLDLIWKQRFTFGRPFVRYVLLRYEDGGKELVIKMDHALWDGTLLRLLENQFVQGSSGDCVIPGTSAAKDFYSHQYVEGKDRDIAYWQQQQQHISTKPRLFGDLHKCRITHKVTTQVGGAAEKMATRSGTTVATAFQAAFQVWLANESYIKSNAFSSKMAASYDYLLTGRNLDLPNPQAINTNCANFVPLVVNVDIESSIEDFATLTQDTFWEATGHGRASLRDIYDGRTEGDRNKVMFLYQPFEPVPNTSATDLEAYGYVSLAKSEVTMHQPYALIVEAAKSHHGHVLKIMWDENVFDIALAEDVGSKISAILYMMSTGLGTRKVKDVF